MILPSLLSDEQRMQVTHDKWAHPSDSMASKNHKHHHGKSFPRDFLQLLPKTSCLVCPLSKGAHQYKHTARFNEVGTQRVPVQRGGGAQFPQPTELTVNVTDELEVTGLLTDGCVDVSIDFAHAICKGINKELYYLEIIAHGVEFTWGIPTQDLERPEIHLQQFMDLTGLRFRTIRHDDAAEFALSETFRAWAASVHAVLEPVAGYKHKLNGKAEGAVCIAKEHVRCLLRTANMPR
eukprot:1628206-Rhodomonas_salina.1